MTDILAALDAAAELALNAKATPCPPSVLPPPEWCRFYIACEDLDHAAVAASLRAKDAEIERLREALRNIADVPACSPDGQLYYEIASEDGQTGVMPVDPIGWIQDAANKARAALTPAAGATLVDTEPLGNCRNCGRPFYTTEGFCGGCKHA